MGIDWMNRETLNEAIPPAYAEWLGRQAIDHIRHECLLRATPASR